MCSPKKPETSSEAVGALCCGIFNILFPGIPACVYGCIVGDGGAIFAGLFQLLLTPLLVGFIWAIVYGVLLIVAYGEFHESHPAQCQSAPPPLTSVVATSPQAVSHGAPIQPGYQQQTPMTAGATPATTAPPPYAQSVYSPSAAPVPQMPQYGGQPEQPGWGAPSNYPQTHPPPPYMGYQK